MWICKLQGKKMLSASDLLQFSIIATLFLRSFGDNRMPDNFVGVYPHKTTIINEGDAIEISCESKKPLVFYHPASNAMFGSSNFTTSKKELPSGLTLYTFQRPKSNYKDTGFYGCVEDDGTSELTRRLGDFFQIPKPLNLTYFFVKSKEYAFCHRSSLQIVGWLEGSDMLIYCPTTSPDIRVELEHHRNGNRKVITTDKRVSWDPKYGFMLKKVRPMEDSGLYICKANHNGHPQENTRIMKAIKGPFYNNPHIEVEKKAIKQGMSMNLNCTVEIANLTKYEIKWTTPQKSDRISTKTHTILAYDNTTIVKKQLIIDNFSDEDNGDYKCTFTISDNSVEGSKIMSIQKTLKIYDPSMRYMKLDYDRADKSFVRYPGETLLLVASVDGQPPPEVKWLNPGGERMQHSEKFEVADSTFMPRLFMKNIQLEDAGVYTLHLSQKGETRMMNFTLTVKS